MNEFNNAMANSRLGKKADNNDIIAVKQDPPILREQLNITIGYINECIYNINDVTKSLEKFLPIEDKDNGNIAVSIIDIDTSDSNITTILETISDTIRIVSIRSRLLNNHLLKLV